MTETVQGESQQQEQQERAEEQADQFRFTSFDIKVIVAGIVRTERITGWVLGDTGLGYYQHPYLSDRVRPTHLPTGYALSHGYMTPENCQAYLEEIAPKCDWHTVTEKGPALELRKELTAIREKYIAVPWTESESETEQPEPTAEEEE